MKRRMTPMAYAILIFGGSAAFAAAPPDPLRVTPIVRLTTLEEVRQLQNPGELRKKSLFLDRRRGRAISL